MAHTAAQQDDDVDVPADLGVGVGTLQRRRCKPSGASPPHADPTATLGLGALEGWATISVQEPVAILGIGRSAAYEAARRGQLPTRRLGRRLFVPVPALLRWLGGEELPPSDVSQDRPGPATS